MQYTYLERTQGPNFKNIYQLLSPRGYTGKTIPFFFKLSSRELQFMKREVINLNNHPDRYLSGIYFIWGWSSWILMYSSPKGLLPHTLPLLKKWVMVITWCLRHPQKAKCHRVGDLHLEQIFVPSLHIGYQPTLN